MRYSFLLTLALAFALSFDMPRAHAGEPYKGRREFRPYLTQGETQFNIGIGVRTDKIDWNIANDITGTLTPNILSELEWDNVSVWEVRGKIRHLEPANLPLLRGNIMLEAEGALGLIMGGDGVDSDYNGDNRTAPFSISTHDLGYSHTASGFVDAGYQFNLAQRIRPGSRQFVRITPFIGYGWDQTALAMENGVQTFPTTGSLDGLDSEYIITWEGPFWGIEAEFENNRHLFQVRSEFHDLDYEGEGIWNLRDNFAQDPSFVHKADGDAFKANIKYSYFMDEKSDFTIDLTHFDRSAEDGTDETYLSNGTSATTRFNEVNHSSQSVYLGLNYRW